MPSLNIDCRLAEHLGIPIFIPAPEIALYDPFSALDIRIEREAPGGGLYGKSSVEWFRIISG